LEIEIFIVLMIFGAMGAVLSWAVHMYFAMIAFAVFEYVCLVGLVKEKKDDN